MCFPLLVLTQASLWPKAFTDSLNNQLRSQVRWIKFAELIVKEHWEKAWQNHKDLANVSNYYSPLEALLFVQGKISYHNNSNHNIMV